MKRTSILSAIVVALLPLSAVAQTIDKNDNGVRMTLGNDIYTAGDQLNLSDGSPGDIFAIGQNIRISGTVGADVHAAGNSITIDAPVADDIRAAGSDITINDEVRGDVMVAGSTIRISEDARISGNLLVAGETVIIDGTVRGNIRVSANSVIINASVGGDLFGDAQKMTINGSVGHDATISAKQLTFGQSMNVQGDVRYWNEQGQLETAGKVQGSAVFDPELAHEADEVAETPAAAVIAAVLAAITVYSLLSASLIIILLMLATRTMFVDSAKRLQKQPGKSILAGMLYFIATPGVILLTAITFIGLPVALALLAIYLITAFFANVISAMVLARWAEVRMKKKWHPVGVFFATLGMFVLLKLIGLVPFIGWIASFVIISAAYGALAMVKLEKYKRVM